ncbi:glycosyltransferase [Patescibacteria group bacterium]|nr:glycosyltransferase [Patescibacteria group bacterium]
MTEAALYVTLFLALYFQTFALLTFLSKDARQRRTKVRLESDFPRVAVIVPCWNEETTIRGTVESLLALDYPREKLELILVNDGSTDNTARVLNEYRAHPMISVIHKQNGGKHSAVNLGAARTRAEFIGCLDADSFVHPGALKEVLAHFDDPRVASVTASMTVHEPRTILERMQYAEYLAGVALRHILATVNGLYVTPGPFSFYRASIIRKLGGFRHGHQTEDMEMAMRLQRHGYRIENAPRAQVFTKAPKTVWKLVKQRTRWTSGFIRNAYDYRDLMFNHNYGVLGLLVLPLGVLALISAMGLTVLAITDTSRMVATALRTQGDVPWSFAFSAPRMDWFYAPITEALVLSIVGIATVTAIMYIGKAISGAQKPIAQDILWYLACYSLVAPIWVFRSAAYVALGVRNAWR